MNAVLERLQAHLSRLYDGAVLPRVEAFLIDQAAHARMPGAREGLAEQLFVGGDDQGVDLSLYLAPQVLEELAAADPWRRLAPNVLPSFLLAVEGVSHFMMVVFSAQRGRTVSALELELQAEVDKFLVVAELWGRQADNPRDALRQLWRHLFADVRLQPQVPAAEHERYRLASSAAASFCRRLLDGGASALTRSALTQASRRFVRWPLADKLRAVRSPRRCP